MRNPSPLRQQTAQELEQGLLAACWNDEDNAKLLLSTTTESDFHTPSASLQFRILKEGWKNYNSCEIFTLKKMSADRGWAESYANVFEAWSSNDWSGYGPSHLRSLIDQVRDESCRVRIIKALRDGEAVLNDPLKPLSEAQAEVSALLSKAAFLSRRSKAQSWQDGFGSLAEAAQKKIEEEAAGNKVTEHLTTGIAPLDEVIGGIGIPELVVLAARPRVGKTAAALQIGTHVATHFGTVLFLSLEISKRVCWTRIACQQLQLPSKDVWGSPDLIRKVQAKNVRLHIDDSPLRVDQLQQRIELFVVEHPDTCLVLVDQLSVMVGDSSDYKSMTYGSNTARRVTREVGIPLCLLAQVGRKGEERNGARPNLADLKATGSLEEDARKVIFIHRPPLYRPKGQGDPGEALFVVAKNGEGQEGDAHAHYTGQTYTFSGPLEAPKKSKKKDVSEPTPTDLDMGNLF